MAKINFKTNKINKQVKKDYEWVPKEDYEKSDLEPKYVVSADDLNYLNIEGVEKVKVIIEDNKINDFVNISPSELTKWNYTYKNGVPWKILSAYGYRYNGDSSSMAKIISLYVNKYIAIKENPGPISADTKVSDMFAAYQLDDNKVIIERKYYNYIINYIENN